MSNNGKDANLEGVGVPHKHGVKEEKSAWVKSAFFLSIQKSTMGGVCVEAWTDSPATPLPKQLTAITSLSYQKKLLTEGGWK